MVTRHGLTNLLLVACCATSLLAGFSQADVVEHTFDVAKMTLSRLCKERTVVAVNGQVPGPNIEAHEGDTVVIHVLNNSPYNLSVHWHGIFQRLSGWADGPTYITQCPILPGDRYTYRFNVTGQEGTLWWHAHFSYLRATVYGPLIIRPKKTSAAAPWKYPFGVKPYAEVPIVLGEYWDADVIRVEDDALRTGALPNNSDAFTINGLPGSLYPCSSDETTFSVKLKQGETYLLRVINAALNNQLFFMIAGHRFTVVAVDAGYTEPYSTDVLVLAPGHTVDALVVADADPMMQYFMAARAYFTPQLPFDNTTSVGIVQYEDHTSGAPLMPALPPFNDTPTANRFYGSLLSSAASAEANKVPLKVDHKMFVTFGLALVPCDKASGPNCNPPINAKFAATMNNISFEFPTKMSKLEASFLDKTDGVFTRNFPDRPQRRFNFTDVATFGAFPFNNPLMRTVKDTRVKRIKYNSTVEVVLQNIAFLGTENHPIHLHGYNFFVLAQGVGNYNSKVAEKKFNLVNPLVRNTVAVPDGGWAVIRFVADNPGVWIMHCHLDVHLPIGLAMAFEVENGHTPSSTLPPPPEDFPRC